MHMFGDTVEAVANGIAGHTDDILRRELIRFLGQDFTVEMVKARCVMHHFADGSMHLVVDGEPVVAMSKLSVTSKTDADGNHAVRAQRSVRRLKS